MAKDTPTRQNVNAEGRPALPLATARELARVELARATQLYDLVALAASVEDQEAGWHRRVEAAEQAARAAEHAVVVTVEACDLRVLEAEREALRRLDVASAELQRFETEASVIMADLRAKIDAAQAELIAIGRDQDAARTARAEYTGLLAEVQALRTERDELVAKLTR